MRNLDQAFLFLQEYKERYEHFYDIFVDKLAALNETLKKEIKETERVGGLYNQEVADTEAASKNAKIVKQLSEKSVKSRTMIEKCYREQKWLSALSGKFKEKSEEAIQQFRVVSDNIREQKI